MKQIFYKDILFLLKNKEKVERYKLKIPNGALLYGPPGCGKTYIAEKFAQESGLNFMMVKASDLGSIYIHGTQGKIAELFKLNILFIVGKTNSPPFLYPPDSSLSTER